uniref:Ankyrin repeat-containing protein At5g02620-like n=1 Tax=Elaeis guineensis var. tenera TaxID=51953 RepID=A0A6J0PCY4_ELAGV|nr:ankyrin repeat-containing protein At5g02620-like [Elaeis guineensis]
MVKESMTSKIALTDSDLEVPQSEVQPLCIAMNPKLLETRRSGDQGVLDESLRQEDFCLGASVSEIAITISEDVAIQNDTSCLHKITQEGNIALHRLGSQRNLELAGEICHKGESLLMAPNMRLDTPLHYAARDGDDKKVSIIIQSAKEGRTEARVLTARNKNEGTALHEAAKYNNERVAEILLEADDGLASMLNDDGMSPLYLAIVTGSFNVAKVLLQSSFWMNASLESYTGPNGKTALHVAVHLSREITEEILKRKPMLAKCIDSSGRAPLHYAAIDGDRDTVKLLLEYDPCTAYRSDTNGLFPIHMAASMGNFHIVDQILQQCFETSKLLDKEGKNFLHVAVQRRRLDMVKKIISLRPSLKELLNDQDNQGNTPLHTAVENSDQRSVHFLLRDETVLFNIVNRDGFTPLDLACEKMDEGLHFWMNAEYCIASCLALIKAHSSPRELHDWKRVVPSSDGNEDKTKPSSDDKVKENSSSGEEIEMKKMQDEELKKELDIPKNWVVAAVLIATVTFAAGFTVPGGYIADDHPGRGTIVLAKEYAFKVFLVSDAWAFVWSMLATTWFMYAGTSTVDKHTRRRVFFLAWQCLWVAFSGMSTAFAMGIYATLAHSSASISILLCIIVLTTPPLATVVSEHNLLSMSRTVGIRQGYRHCIWPTTIHPQVGKVLRPALQPVGARVIYSLLPMLVAYAIFFLFPLLFVSKN